ncbi:MAG: cytochrome P450 [Candidatus Hydrogenedentota bacterium]
MSSESMPWVDRPKVIPGPKRLFPPMNLRDLAKDTFGYLTHLRETYGPISVISTGVLNIYFMNDPEIIREVLVTKDADFQKGLSFRVAKRLLGDGLLTSEGEFHRQQRRLAQPAFHRQRIANYAMIMENYARAKAESWSNGDIVDMDLEMMKLTLSVVAKTLFDANVEEEARAVGDALSAAMVIFDRTAWPMEPLVHRLPLESNRRFNKGKQDLDNIVYRIIRERRASGEDRGDLLSMLLAAQDEDDGHSMTDLQVRDEAVTIFLAGHETTANILGWTWYNIARNPEVEARIHTEVDAVIPKGLPAFEAFAQLPYTRDVFSEALRMYPPVYLVGRQAMRTTTVGPYRIPKWSIILISQFFMHRDPRFWDRPNEFEPSRWTDTMRERLPKFAYFPFGGGQRFCLGDQFAWMEGVLILAILAHKWKMRLVDSAPIEPHPQVTLRPSKPIRMQLEARNP